MTFGQIAVAALNLEANDFKKWWIAGPAGFFALSVFWTALHLYKCAYPHLKGGEGSLIYFGEISKFQELEFVSLHILRYPEAPKNGDLRSTRIPIPFIHCVENSSVTGEAVVVLPGGLHVPITSPLLRGLEEAGSMNGGLWAVRGIVRPFIRPE